MGRKTLIALWLSVAPLGMAMAHEFEALTGAQIKEALTGQKMFYTSAWQEFKASGRTLYNAGSDSWGYWEVRGDQYCSQWPPRSEWACYDMQRHGEVYRFIGPGNDITDGFLDQ